MNQKFFNKVNIDKKIFHKKAFKEVWNLINIFLETQDD